MRKIDSKRAPESVVKTCMYVFAKYAHTLTSVTPGDIEEKNEGAFRPPLRCAGSTTTLDSKFCRRPRIVFHSERIRTTRTCTKKVSQTALYNGGMCGDSVFRINPHLYCYMVITILIIAVTVQMPG